MSEIQSKVYRPDARKCCEACAFGRGEHAMFCVVYWRAAWRRELERVPCPPRDSCAACVLGIGNHAEWCTEVANAP